MKVPDIVIGRQRKKQKILNDKKLGFKVVTRKESKKYEGRTSQ